MSFSNACHWFPVMVALHYKDWSMAACLLFALLSGTASDMFDSRGGLSGMNCPPVYAIMCRIAETFCHCSTALRLLLESPWPLIRRSALRFLCCCVIYALSELEPRGPQQWLITVYYVHTRMLSRLFFAFELGCYLNRFYSKR